MNKFCKKCVVLYSGGLDSLLALKIMSYLGFEVHPLFVNTPFYKKDIEQLKKVVNDLNIELHIASNDEEYIKIVKNPDFGYGKNLNPCVDCKIFFLKEAKKFMDKIDACFIVTGEVLGQRPMSQRSYSIMRAIEKRANLKDMVLRVLSAKCLPETEMEKNGIVDREKLFCITGRSRKEQMELAKKFGINYFESPAGGCLLTDKAISLRVKEMLQYGYNSMLEIELLSIGRHFRINSKRFVVSRKKDETYFMLNKFKSILPIIKCHKAPGAIGVFAQKPEENDIRVAASILKRYSKKAEYFEYIYGNDMILIASQTISEKQLEFLKIN